METGIDVVLPEAMTSLLIEYRMQSQEEEMELASEVKEES
jgi:hypothetical protein